MDSPCDQVHEALDEFLLKFEGRDCSSSSTVWGLAVTFAKEFRYLKLFLDCTLKWSDAVRHVPYLETLGSKIEAVIQQVGSQIMKAIPKESKRASRTVIKHYSLSKAASNAIRVLTKCLTTIVELKAEIRRLYKESLSSIAKTTTFLHDSPLQVYAQWKKLVDFNFIFHDDIDISSSSSSSSSVEKLNQIHFLRNIQQIVCFIEDLIDTGPENPRIEFIMVHIASIAVRASFLYIGSWLCPKDPTFLNEMANSFKLLRRNTDLSTSKELVDLLLSLLQSYSRISEDGAETQVKRFLEELYNLQDSYSTTTYIEKEEMESLLKYVINSPDEDAQLFWADVRMLVMKAYSYKYISFTDCGQEVKIKFLMKICLIKKEIFLMRQIKTTGGGGYRVSSGITEQLLLNSQRLTQFYKTVFEFPRDENMIQILKLIMEFDSDASEVLLISREMVKKNELFKLLSKILLAKANLFLEGLNKENESLTELDNDSIDLLLEGLKHLAMFVEIKQSKINTLNSSIIFEGIRAFARELYSLCSLFPDDKIPETMAKNVNNQISVSQDKINVMMMNIKRFYLDIPVLKLPTTNKIHLVDSLLRDIKQLLICKQGIITDVNDNIDEVGRNLKFLRPFLASVVETQDTVAEELNVVTTRAVVLIHEMQYFVDKILLGGDVSWLAKCWIYSLLQDFRLVTSSLEKETCDPELHINSDTIMQMKTLDSNSRVDQVVTAASTDQQDLIIDRLTLRALREDILAIVSIVGMAGIGKTTLANQVYNHPRIVNHFHVRAWCNVSLKYKKRELLLDLLSLTIGLTDSILEMSDEDLQLKLRQSLMHRRYLIVMDDLWDAGAWDELVTSLPNDGNGSRILVTSRFHEVVKWVNAENDPPHLVSLLSDDESWELFRMKVFQEGGCPADLIEIGKLIVHNCKGLPLAVVALAGIMERSERTPQSWNQIAENLRSQILDDPQTRCSYILGLSYKHLPDSLKECLLYFGAFERGTDVPVQKLIRLWIAEGFIPTHGTKSFEDVAGDYLMDLVGRSLVMVVQRSPLGGIKACRLHDVLHELCHSIAMEDNFLNRVIGSEEQDTCSNDLDYGVDPIPSDQFTAAVRFRYEDHRLSIFSKRKHFVSSSPSGPHVRSLLFFGMSDAHPRCPYDITFITSYFKLVKVLDLECINMGHSFPKDLELLIHLRYLALCGDIDLVPESIDKLFNLQTLIIKALKGQVALPYTIWSMSSLRHLHVRSRALFDFGDGDLSYIPQRDGIVTLSLLFLYHEENTRKILSRLPNLKSLSCAFAESSDQSGKSKSSLRLDSLAKLESLKILHFGKPVTPTQLYFPSNLRNLTLSNFHLPWDHISAIGKLQHLEVLKLLSHAFEGEKWDMVEGEFTKLNFLKLEGLNLVQWNVYDDHLPNLQVLVLQNCKDLEELPPSFTCIPTLQLIEVKQCGSSLEESVRNIDEEGIRVLIHSSNMEPRS